MTSNVSTGSSVTVHEEGEGMDDTREMPFDLSVFGRHYSSSTAGFQDTFDDGPQCSFGIE